MSLIKQLLNTFVEWDEDKKDVGGKENPPPVVLLQATATLAAAPDENAYHPLINAAPKPTEAAQTPVYSPSGTLAKPTPEHQQYFEQLIEEANRTNPIFAGADYKEFTDSKVDINDITDEALRYQTAFNILKASGLTKAKLLSTGQAYINLIGHDMNAFQSAHAGQYAKEVGQKEALIQKKAEELQALTQRLTVLKSEINGLTQDIKLAKDKLDTIKNSFLLAGENKQQEIQAELEKIAHYF